MKKTKLLLAISLLGLLSGVYHAAAIGTAFTYQGRLADNGSPASGNYDLRFSVWDSAVGGLQVGGSVVVSPVSVSGGLFTVPLDFGAGSASPVRSAGCKLKRGPCRSWALTTRSRPASL